MGLPPFTVDPTPTIFFALGVQGAIWLQLPLHRGGHPGRDGGFRGPTQAIAAGEMTKDPASNVYAPEFLLHRRTDPWRPGECSTSSPWAKSAR